MCNYEIHNVYLKQSEFHLDQKLSKSLLEFSFGFHHLQTGQFCMRHCSLYRAMILVLNFLEKVKWLICVWYFSSLGKLLHTFEIFLLKVCISRFVLMFRQCVFCCCLVSKLCMGSATYFQQLALTWPDHRRSCDSLGYFR